MLLIKISICFSYFIIGGLATTNILRLTTGNTLSVLSSECHCADCGMRIRPLNQMPIISFVFSKGHCKNCGIKLPVDALILEIIVFVGMTVVSVIGDFSLLSVFISFIYYEIIRIACIIKYGRRKKDFFKQYILALIGMFGFIVLVEFMACLLKTSLITL